MVGVSAGGSPTYLDGEGVSVSISTLITGGDPKPLWLGVADVHSFLTSSSKSEGMGGGPLLVCPSASYSKDEAPLHLIRLTHACENTTFHSAMYMINNFSIAHCEFAIFRSYFLPISETSYFCIGFNEDI